MGVLEVLAWVFLGVLVGAALIIGLLVLFLYLIVRGVDDAEVEPRQDFA